MSKNVLCDLGTVVNCIYKATAVKTSIKTTANVANVMSYYEIVYIVCVDDRFYNAFSTMMILTVLDLKRRSSPVNEH